MAKRFLCFMNKLQQLFSTQKKKFLNIYCTAGYPNLNDTKTVINALIQEGVDIIEIGMPYSDPLADGETIQQSSCKAIENGMNLQVLFEQLQSIKNIDRQNTALILMGYFNPILQFGLEKFCKQCQEVEIDALIIPDLPVIEFETNYKNIFEQYNLSFIFLVTPQTSKERVLLLDSLSTGFLYAVSSSSITGTANNFVAVESYLKRLQSYQLKNPIMVGFGISNRDDFKRVCTYSNGAIIGSAFIKHIKDKTNIQEAAKEFVRDIRL
jgi:tryptophan synthase alpha chain